MPARARAADRRLDPAEIVQRRGQPGAVPKGRADRPRLHEIPEREVDATQLVVGNAEVVADPAALAGQLARLHQGEGGAVVRQRGIAVALVLRSPPARPEPAAPARCPAGSARLATPPARAVPRCPACPDSCRGQPGSTAPRREFEPATLPRLGGPGRDPLDPILGLGLAEGGSGGGSGNRGGRSFPWRLAASRWRRRLPARGQRGQPNDEAPAEYGRDDRYHRPPSILSARKRNTDGWSTWSFRS